MWPNTCCFNTLLKENLKARGKYSFILLPNMKVLVSINVPPEPLMIIVHPFYAHKRFVGAGKDDPSPLI